MMGLITPDTHEAGEKASSGWGVLTCAGPGPAEGTGSGAECSTPEGGGRPECARDGGAGSPGGGAGEKGGERGAPVTR